MNIAFYLNYGYYLDTRAALAKLKEHGIGRIVSWVGRDVDSATTVSEYELFGYVKDNGLAIDAAIVPNDQLAYLSNTRYGRKDAIKAYKQYVLTAVDQRIPLLIVDAAPTCDAYVEAMREICAFAKEQGVLVAVRDGVGVDTVALLSEVEDLYYCLDTAACIKNGIDVPQRLGAVGKRLMYVLLSDLGHDDTRYLPTYGNTDFGPILAAIKNAGYVGTVAYYASNAKGIDSADEMIEAAKAIG